MNKKTIGLGALLTLSLTFLLAACGSTTSSSDDNSDNVNNNTNESQTIPDEVDTSTDSTTISESTSKTNTTEERTTSIPTTATKIVLVQDGTVAKTGVTVSKNVVTISSDGSYVLSGTLTDGYIVIKKNTFVHLYLNEVTISTSTGSPFVFKKDESHTDPSVVTLVKGSVNTITDANLETYTSGDENDDGTFANNAAFYAKRAVTFNGEGSLTVKSYYHAGIRTKGNLSILDGTFTINAYDNGIKGDTNLFLLGGDLNVTSLAGDGIKTDEPDTTDTYSATLYNAKFKDVNLTIDAKYDAIQVYNMVFFDGGTYNLTNYGKVANRSTYEKDYDLDENGNKQYDDNGDVELVSSKTIKTGLDWASDMSDGSSSIYIKSGDFTIDSVDDAFNANNGLFVEGGTFEIKAGDDGMHADSVFEISGGTVNISTCYEGMEAAKMIFAGGDVSINSTDDGINAANKHGSVADGQYDSACQIYFNGTNIYVSAAGDGIDSNGCAQFNDGTILIEGPSDSGNSAIDTNGGYVINGGTIIAAGSTGMLELPKSNGTQYSATLSATITKGTVIKFTDESGNTLYTYTATKTGGSVTYSSSKLALNGTYKLYINGSLSKSWTQSVMSFSDVTTSNGSNEGVPGGSGQPGGGNNKGPGK